MKKLIFLILIPVVFFISCASNSPVAVSSANNVHKENDLDKQKLQSTKERQNPDFSDWKYKGFGQELPLWINDVVFKNEIPELKNIDNVIVKCSADNLDQSEKLLKAESAKYKDLFLYDTFWVKLKDSKVKENYISIAIFTTKEMK